jgi:lipid II:glycine glycyltransferase (peptidoglycan interpeptide bridge formation enzyme)
VHIQYSASTEDGRAVAALDRVTWTAIERARTSGARWFSFGISTENEGRALNTTLFRFKESFGATSVVHEHFDLPLV